MGCEVCQSTDVVNVTQDLCSLHFDEMRERRRAEKIERLKQRPVISRDAVEYSAGCPYCMTESSAEVVVCCGEAGHQETFVLYKDELYTESEFNDKYIIGD